MQNKTLRLVIITLLLHIYYYYYYYGPRNDTLVVPLHELACGFYGNRWRHPSSIGWMRETTQLTSGSVAGLSLAAALPFSLVLDPARDIFNNLLGQSDVHYLEKYIQGISPIKRMNITISTMSVLCSTLVEELPF